MSQIANTLIARYEKNSQRFEVLIDPKKGPDFKSGAKKDFDNVLMFDEVFKDANKGERQTSAAIQKAFGTTDPLEVAQIIIREGDLQITTDQRRKLLEDKKRKVIDLIARNCMDPKAKAPHPPHRIERALEEARFRFDAFKTPEEQMADAIESIREILPISLEKLKIAVRIPVEFAPRSYGTLKEYGIRKEEWGSDGSLMAVIEIAVGIRGEVYDRLNKLTGGQVQTKEL
ncbi:ribosome assembly factor SBDS [Candidatus Micrarchaeota archaeon]|nr:ribosome assembly factor SBDS [Candidatus Micrarchaeota archaeon]